MDVMDIVKNKKISVIPHSRLPKLFNRHSEKKGKPPGEVQYVGDKKDEIVEVTLFDYNDKTLVEKEIKEIETCKSLLNKKNVSWINVTGVHDIELVKKIGETFGIHPLALEDISNTHQLPKMEEFPDEIFIVLKMLSYDSIRKEAGIEQVSIILGKNYVISFQERKGDVFDGVRERIRKGRSRIRGAGNSYLMYALLDAIVDNYFVVLEKLGEEIVGFEEVLMDTRKDITLDEIYKIKRELIFLRKSVWPLREVLSQLMRFDSKLVDEQTLVFLRDVYDHTIQVIDTIETYRDMLSGMLDVHMSKVSNKMNEIMKVLTIIATIFIPLTFIAGIYGMNFENIPELSISWFYPFIWMVMILIAGTMLYFFRRKGWL